MFIKEEEISGHHSLRKRFLKDLDKEIQIWSYKKNESLLRRALEKKIDEILENDKTMVSKEDIKHEIKSNHYMTDKVLKKLEEDGFIRLDRIENRYRIRITKEEDIAH